MSPSSETVEVDFISPRHLAGGGDPAWITVALHRACGWSHGHDPLMPRVLLSSPDQKALLRLEPDPVDQWWILHHAAEWPCSREPTADVHHFERHDGQRLFDSVP